MKTNKFINILLSVLLVVFSLSSCTSDFEDINTNKRVLADIDPATVGNVYGNCQYFALMHYWCFHSFSNVFADHWTQFFANTYGDQDYLDQNSILGDYVDVNGWQLFYNYAAKDIEVVLGKTDPVKSPGFEKQHALTQIWKVYAYQRITDYFGPIVYSQVNNGQPNVPYDSQESIYKNFIVLLDEATTTLGEYRGGNAFGKNDMIYGGDINKWITFANTLRLRIAMRISDVEPALAKTQAEKAVSDGVMEDISDDAMYQTSPGCWNEFPYMAGWGEWRMSASMESLMKGYNDPRMVNYWIPAETDGQYRGLRNGYSAAQLGAAELQPANLSNIGSLWSSSQDNALTTPLEVIRSPEAYFLRAEGALKGWSMGMSAEAAYYKGIEMSLKHWGYDDATIEAYQNGATLPVATHDAPAMTDIPVKWIDGNTTKQLEQVMTQKWLALWPDGWEAWADLRRTDLPNLIPIVQSNEPEVPVGKVPSRVTFAISEYNNNLEAVTNAKTLLGGDDKISTRVWWNPAK